VYGTWGFGYPQTFRYRAVRDGCYNLWLRMPIEQVRLGRKEEPLVRGNHTTSILLRRTRSYVINDGKTYCKVVSLWDFK